MERERAAKETAQAREGETNAMLRFVQDRILAAARPKDQAGGLGYDVPLREAIIAALPFVHESVPYHPLIEGQLRMTLGRSFLSMGDANTSTEQLETARELLGGTLGPDHFFTLLSMIDLASSYEALGRHADALELRDETLALMKAKFGVDHPFTFTGMTNLASSYAALGRHADALKLREETLDRQMAKLLPSDPRTLANMNNLARSYAALGRNADALKLYEKTLTMQKVELGPDHADTLISTVNLADAYLAAKEPKNALRLVGDYLSGQKKRLGDGPRLAGIQASVALKLLTADQAAAAEPILRDCLAIREKAEPNDWTTYNGRSMLGAALFGQQKYVEAEPLLLSGYEGLKARAATIPLGSQIRLAEAAERLVRLYEATDRADEAAKWKDRRTDLLWDLADTPAARGKR